jgi:hypothetical protein
MSARPNTNPWALLEANGIRKAAAAAEESRKRARHDEPERGIPTELSRERLTRRTKGVLDVIDTTAWDRSETHATIKFVLTLTPHDTKHKEPHPAAEQFALEFYTPLGDKKTVQTLRKRIQMMPDQARYFDEKRDLTLHAALHVFIENAHHPRLRTACMTELAKWNAKTLVIKSADFDEPDWEIQLVRNSKGELTEVSLDWEKSRRSDLLDSLCREAYVAELHLVRAVTHSVITKTE